MTSDILAKNSEMSGFVSVEKKVTLKEVSSE